MEDPLSENSQLSPIMLPFWEYQDLICFFCSGVNNGLIHTRMRGCCSQFGFRVSNHNWILLFRLRQCRSQHQCECQIHCDQLLFRNTTSNQSGQFNEWGCEWRWLISSRFPCCLSQGPSQRLLHRHPLLWWPIHLSKQVGSECYLNFRVLRFGWVIWCLSSPLAAKYDQCQDVDRISMRRDDWLIPHSVCSSTRPEATAEWDWGMFSKETLLIKQLCRSAQHFH
jgi:hypothetical protein